MWMWIALAEGACGITDLERSLDAFEASWTQMSDDFADRGASVREHVDCLSQPLSPALARRFHRAAALEAFVAGDGERVRRAFSRYRSLAPGQVLETTWAPEGHPLQDAFAAADLVPEWAALPTPAEGWVIVDGEQSLRAPADLPYVFQLLSDEGAVMTTTRVPASGTAPSYPVLKEGQDTPKARRRGLLYVGVGAAAVGALTYGSAFTTRSRYTKAVAAGDRGRIEKTHRTTNTLTIAGAGLMVAGGGLTLVGVL